MRCVVMELQIMVDNCMVGVVKLEEVFQRSSLLFMLCLDIVNLD